MQKLLGNVEFYVRKYFIQICFKYRVPCKIPLQIDWQISQGLLWKKTTLTHFNLTNNLWRINDFIYSALPEQGYVILFLSNLNIFFWNI